VRQLQHCIERAVALHVNGPIDMSHLFPTGECCASPLPANDPAPVTPGYQDARADFEREYFRRVLDAAGGNVSEAARLSGIPRQNLYVRMKRWGIVTDK